jgi:hypothetical protein
MHFNDLGSMAYGEAGVTATETLALLFQRAFVPDENNLDVQLLDSLEGALKAGSGTVVASHRVERNLHSGWCAHR